VVRKFQGGQYYTFCFAELGWIKNDEVQPELSSEWYDVSETHNFKIEFDSNGEVEFYEGDTLKETLDWDDTGAPSGVVDKAEEKKYDFVYVQSEKLRDGSIPGTSNDPVKFENMQYKEAGGNWTTITNGWNSWFDNEDVVQGYPITCSGTKIIKFQSDRWIKYNNDWAKIYE